MTNYTPISYANNDMSFLDRSIRIGLGLAVLFGTLHFSVIGGDAYPLTKLFAAVVVLTGIVGWDPFYAVFRNTMSRLTNMEALTLSTGNISMPDRALRIGLGLTALVISIQGPMGSMESFMVIKMVATLAVLTGIAGWDPFYATYRNIASRFWNMKLQKSLAYSPIG